jgi:pimeloyl-ACP methyl ester carboxylesterase
MTFATGAAAMGALAPSTSLARAVFSAPSGPWTHHHKLRRVGGSLHYATIGEPVTGKPPLILLHKLGGWLSDWRFVAPALAQGRQVIAFDLPGHGQSNWDGPPPYMQTLGETAAILIGALDELGMDQADLAGTSLGGCLAVVLGAFWPERFRRIAIVSSALGGHRTLAEIAALIDAKQTVLFDKSGDPIPTSPALLKSTFGIVHAEEINPEGIASRKAAGRWIQPSERGVASFDIKGTLRRIEAPVLLLYGEYDKAYFKFRADAEARLKHSRTEIVPNSGAFVMQDNPPATAAILRRYFDEAG